MTSPQTEGRNHDQWLPCCFPASGQTRSCVFAADLNADYLDNQQCLHSHSRVQRLWSVDEKVLSEKAWTWGLTSFLLGPLHVSESSRSHAVRRPFKGDFKGNLLVSMQQIKQPLIYLLSNLLTQPRASHFSKRMSHVSHWKELNVSVNNVIKMNLHINHLIWAAPLWRSSERRIYSGGLQRW